MSDARTFLRRVPFFADLSDDDCDAVLGVLKARQGRPGDTLFREGDPGNTLLIVVDGQLEASVKTSSGTQAHLSTIPAGHVVGELAFLDAAPRAATVTTPKGARVLEFSRSALIMLCKEHPKIAATIQRNVLADLAKRVRAIEGTQAGGPNSKRAPATARTSLNPEPPRSMSSASIRKPGRSVTAAQLRTVPVLESYSTEDLELLAYTALLRGFARGEHLMVEGAEGDAAYLILSGSVTATRAGASMALATLEPGALVGQLALLDRAPRSATVTAVTDTTVLELKANVVANLVKAWSPMALRFQREIATAAARHLRIANANFAAAQGAAGQGPLDGADGDWSAEDDMKIELGVDPSVLKH
jgi:CRP-like cAMP-binding protein